MSILLKQIVETLIRRRLLRASDLGLHCLSMSQKRKLGSNGLTLAGSSSGTSLLITDFMGFFSGEGAGYD